MELERFIAIVKDCSSLTEVLKRLKLSSGSSKNYRECRELIHFLDLDVTHFRRKISQRKRRARRSNEEIFVKSRHEHNISKYVFERKILPRICSICSLKDEWNGKPLSLQVDHINGDRTDNRISNLRYLCPNCHSQTDTFCGRNLKGKKVRERLQKLKER